MGAERFSIRRAGGRRRTVTGRPAGEGAKISMSANAIPLQHNLQSDHLTGLGAIVDVETTGVSHRDEVIEVGLVLFAYHRSTGKLLAQVDEYAGLREPTVPISPWAYRVHRISDEAVRGQRLDFDRIESILTRAEFIIAHNASFDRRFVSPLSDTAREKPWLCSMSGIDWAGKGYRSRGLQPLLAAHRIATETAHRALSDVYAVLHLLAHPQPERTYLSELLDNPADRRRR